MTPVQQRAQRRHQLRAPLADVAARLEKLEEAIRGAAGECMALRCELARLRRLVEPGEQQEEQHADRPSPGSGRSRADPGA